jgi:hypothetical protein
MLVLFLGVPAPTAVGIGLTFSAAVKFILVPAQIARRNVVWPTLGRMLLGGVPGVLVGALLLKHLVSANSQNILNLVLGLILVTVASAQIVFMFQKLRSKSVTDRSAWLPGLMLFVGAEVGFSSAGAGALGSSALLGLTPLNPAQVVGTDILFGFVLSTIGSSVHWFSMSLAQPLLCHLIEGGILGAVAGTFVSRRIPLRPLRFALLVWILFLGGDILFSNFHAVAH